MAWELKFGGGGEYLSLASDVSLSGDFTIRVKFRINNGVSNSIFFGHRVDNGHWYGVYGDLLRFNLGGLSGGITMPSDGAYYTAEAVRVGSQITSTLYDENDNVVGSEVLTSSNTITIGVIGRFRGGSTAFSMDGALQYLDLNNQTYLDATASNHGAGQPVLADTIGTNNATAPQGVMPEDGSAWVDLGGGATPIDVTAILGTITYNSQSPTVTLTGSVDVTPTLGTINYTSQSANVSLTGDIDVSTTIGAINYQSQKPVVTVSANEVNVSPTLGSINYQSHSTQIQLAGVIDATATLGTINYSSHSPTVSVTGDIDVSPTLGTINYQSHNTQITVTGDVNITATLGTINYQSQAAQVILQGTIQAQATLGQINYQSRKATVYFEEAQSIDSFTVNYKQDDVSMSYKNDSFSVTYKN